jgi:hypothetical protein
MTEVLAAAFFATLAFLSACAPPMSELQGRTSALTGCSPTSIAITDVTVGMKTGTYTAQCQGKTYYCGGDDNFRNVACTEAK